MLGKLLSTTTLAGITLIAASFFAAQDTVRAQQAQRVQHAQTSLSNRPGSPAASRTDRGQLLEEAVSALRDTQNALVAIDRSRPNEAIAALERATGKLEILLARSPSLALAPVDVSAVTYDVLGTVQSVENVRAEAKAAINRGRLQDARRLISDLGSETIVSVSSLPRWRPIRARSSRRRHCSTKAGRSKRKGCWKPLSTLVVDRVIVPLPLVRAQAAVEQARGLAAKANRTAAENARLRSQLADARAQLRLGQALGYATERDMKNLLDAVDEIDRKTSGQQHGTGLLDRIGGLFDTARNASQPHGARR